MPTGLGGFTTYCCYLCGWSPGEVVLNGRSPPLVFRIEVVSQACACDECTLYLLGKISRGKERAYELPWYTLEIDKQAILGREGSRSRDVPS